MSADRSSLHSSHFPYLQFDNTHQMWLLNGLRISREVGNKLVMFFMPLFLYQLGAEKLPFAGWLKFDLSPFQQGILWLAAFYLVRNLVVILVNIPLGKLVTKIGPQRTVILAQLGFVVYFWVLYISSQNYWLTLVAAALDGLQTLFWTSYYTILSQNVAKTRIGADLSLISLMLYLVTLLTPIFGGWIIVWQGFGLLFLTGICCVLIGTIFALLLERHKIQDQVSWSEFGSWLKERQYQKLAISYVGRYFNDVVLFIWPLYVFFIIGAIDKVGYLYALSLFLAMMLTYVSGLVLDKTKDRQPFFITGGLLSVFWLVRIWIESVWAIVVIDVCDRLAASYHWLYFDKQFLLRSQGREALSFFVYREIIIAFSSVVFWVLFSLVFGFWLGSLKFLFMAAAVGIWLSLLVREHRLN